MFALRFLVVGLAVPLFLGACVARDSARELDAGTGDAGKRLIMVRNRAFNPFTGEFVRKYDVVALYGSAMPIPGRPGWYEIEAGPSESWQWECKAYQINPTDGLLVKVPFAPRWTWDTEGRVAVRRNDDGSERWRYGEAGQVLDMGPKGIIERNYYPHASAFHNGIHYIAYERALVALNDTTGKEVWRVAKGCAQLLAGEKFLLALLTDTTADTVRLEVVAFAYESGLAIFRIPVGERGGIERLFLSGPRYGISMGPSWDIGHDGQVLRKPAVTKLFLPDGHIFIDVPEALHSIVWGSDNLVTSGTKTVSAWNASGERRWEVDIRKSTDDDERGERSVRELLLMSNGDVITCEYDPIAATDDVVRRLDGLTGKQKWEATCETPPVDHSKYLHEVYLELIDGKLVMCSQQSYAVFVEVLDPATGKQLHRWVLTEKLDE
jgi:hypothetical protein